MKSNMSARPKKVLVTGGAGYVGSTFIRDALAEGYKVRCLDLLVYGGKALVGFMNHPDFEFVRGDVRDIKTLAQSLEDIDYVVHLAAIVGDRPCQAAPVSAYQINLQGTQLIADMAKKKGIKKFVFASTCSNYGIFDPSNPATEESALNPVSLYAELKIDCEKYLRDITSEEFAVTCLRFGTAFGVSFRTRFDLLVNSFAYEAWTSKKIVVFAANTWRPYVHVADMSLIMRQVLRDRGGLAGEIFNAGATTQNFIKRDVVEILKSIMPGLETKYLDSIDDRRDYRVCCQKLEKRLGFVPSRTVQDGFRELLGCFESGILTAADYEANKVENLEGFFGGQEKTLKR